MSSTSQDHGHDNLRSSGSASTARPVSEMESEFLEHASHEDSGQRNDGTAGTSRRRIQLNSCFVCNVAFVAKKLDSLEDRVSWFQNLCNLLTVFPEQGEYLPETNPLCIKCCEVVEEFLYLQRQIEGLKKMIGELSKMLGRRLVDKHTFTSTSRKNYQVKSTIYEVWIKRVNAPESQTFAVNIEESAPAINSRNEVMGHSEQLSVPSLETDSDYALMNTLDSVSSANDLESTQNANCSNNQDCPSPVSVGFQDDDDEGMLDNDNIYVAHLNEETTDIQAENLESDITTAPSIIDYPNKPSSVSASLPLGTSVCETDVSGDDSNFLVNATGSAELQPAKKTANRNVVTKRPAKGRKNHPCKYCGKLLPSNFALEMHVRTHTGERPFKCRICGKGCREKGSLQKHEKTHDESRYEGEPKFECDICGKKYHIKSSLLIHRSDHEKGFTRFKKMPKLSNGPPKPPRKPPVRREKKYDENGNPIPIPKEPKSPNKKKLPNPSSDKPKVYRRRGRPPREGGPIICQQCGKPCKSEFSLKIHIQSHSDSRPFKCSKCQGAFKYKGDLQRHLKEVHNKVKVGEGDPTHVCEVCGTGFYSHGTLYVHRRQNHLGMKDKYKSYQRKVALRNCNICGKTFHGTSKAFQGHKQRHREKKNDCSVCGRPFTFPKEAIAHAETHSPKRRLNEYFRYQCPACPADVLGFSSKLAIRKHWNIAHKDQKLPEIYEKPATATAKKVYPKKKYTYQCLVCPAVDEKIPTYTAWHSLDRHKKYYHLGNSKRQWKPRKEGYGPLKKPRVRRQYKCLICREVDGKRPIYTCSNSLAKHNDYYHSSSNPTRIWTPRPPRLGETPDSKKGPHDENEDTGSESSSEEEFNTENEFEINTSITARRSVRRTRGDSSKLSKSLQAEIEDNDIHTSSKVVRARTLAKKVSDAVTVQSSSKPRIKSAMKSSAKTQGTQLTDSYINEILGGKQPRLILTRVSVGRRSVSGSRGDATEPSNSKSVSDSITELQLRSIASKTDSITYAEKEIVVEDEEYPLPSAKMEVYIEEEISEGMSNEFEPEVPAASSLHCTTLHDASEPRQPTTSFQSQCPIIIHNPLSKNKTTAAPILYVPIKYDAKNPPENEGSESVK